MPRFWTLALRSSPSRRKALRIWAFRPRRVSDDLTLTQAADILNRHIGVSFFMNRFRKMGFVDYGGSGLQVHSSLLNVVLHD